MITKIEDLQLEVFNVVGISVRTTNQNGQSQKDIGDLWTRFMTEGLLNKIGGRTADDIYCVYTNYETDHAGPYTAILGCKVNELGSVGQEFTTITIPAETYKVYHLTGNFPANVGEAWQQIWKSDVKRKYTADFDLYGAGALSFEETDAKIYLAV